jgi:transcriptional regulator with XRE-family HTH domain
MDLKKLAYRIRKLREARDLNQAQMAAKLKITPSAYSKIERGITDPSVGRLDQIAVILKVDIQDFFSDPLVHQVNGQASIEKLTARVDALSRQVDSLQKAVTKSTTAK